MIFEFDCINDAVIEINETDEKVEKALLSLILRICNMAFEKEEEKVVDDLSDS